MTDVAIGQGFDIGRVIERAFSSIRRNFGPFLALAVVFGGLPQALIATGRLAGPADAATGAVLSIVGAFVTVVGSLIVQGGVVKGTVSSLSGQKTSFGDLFQTGFRYALPLFGLGLVYGLMLAIGFILLIVPFFIVLVVFCVAAPALVVERRGIFESFQRSRDLTRGHRWPVFGVLVVFWVMLYVLVLVMGVLIGVSSLAVGGGAGLVGPIVGGLVGTLEGLLTAAAIASIYYELRTIKDGAAPHALLSVFD
jgi:hypothetical protein